MSTITEEMENKQAAEEARQLVHDGLNRLLRIYGRKSQGPHVNEAAEYFSGLINSRAALARNDRDGLVVAPDPVDPDDREMSPPAGTLQGAPGSGRAELD